MKGLMKLAPAPGNMEIRDVAEPAVAPDQVKVEIKGCGICGSDIHVYHAGGIGLAMRYPVVTGHELAGVVVEVGGAVRHVAVGDRVTTETTVSTCGRCLYCRTGPYQLCPERRVLGYWVNGGFTKYTVVPEERIHKLPETVDLLAGALTEPLACCVHGAEWAGLRAGEFVVVTGPGTLGLLSAQVAKAEGATVMVCGTSQDAGRLALARDLGADVTLAVDREDAVAAVRQETDGYGADVVFECSGASAAVDLALQALRRRGRLVQWGLFGQPITIHYEQVIYKEIRAAGSVSHTWADWRKALQYMAGGRVRAHPLITDVMPLTDWKTAFDKFERKEALKIILTPEQ